MPWRSCHPASIDIVTQLMPSPWAANSLLHQSQTKIRNSIEKNSHPNRMAVSLSANSENINHSPKQNHGLLPGKLYSINWSSSWENTASVSSTKKGECKMKINKFTIFAVALVMIVLPPVAAQRSRCSLYPNCKYADLDRWLHPDRF